MPSGLCKQTQIYNLFTTKGRHISLGDVSKNENLFEIKEAARLSNAFDFIDDSSKKFDSNLTKLFDFSGLELSGGQWQRLALARVFFAKSHILIFDEPTSALDSLTESEIYEKIQNLRKDKMIIFVSHKLYAAQNSSKIIYLKGGKITAFGNHFELLKNSSEYKKLFEQQAQKYNLNN